MVDFLLSQDEGDTLLYMKKIAANNDIIDLPDLGGAIDIKFLSENKHEEFILNYSRGRISLSKRNHHLRGRKIIGLARLDLDGPPHRNPNDEEIGPRHLHLYKEGYALKWAYEVPEEIFKNLDDSYQSLEDFMRYCNIVTLPNIRKGLFT